MVALKSHGFALSKTVADQLAIGPPDICHIQYLCFATDPPFVRRSPSLSLRPVGGFAWEGDPQW
jgi:hypothetical protein